ncbi:hypothetical protein PTE_02686 [Photorhabdus khanii NC19]|uniref:Uncharacterized protein n=1 Tax=Photorhabdus khanii NC19 TaxID=1004151 RepID=W3V6J6_9GAMM|nr:hypothetical protein PTE_02686 [Photorhabdus khanii NC19]
MHSLPIKMAVNTAWNLRRVLTAYELSFKPRSALLIKNPGGKTITVNNHNFFCRRDKY